MVEELMVDIGCWITLILQLLKLTCDKGHNGWMRQHVKEICLALLSIKARARHGALIQYGAKLSKQWAPDRLTMWCSMIGVCCKNWRARLQGMWHIVQTVAKVAQQLIHEQLQLRAVLIKAICLTKAAEEHRVGLLWCWYFIIRLTDEFRACVNWHINFIKKFSSKKKHVNAIWCHDE